MEASLWLEVQVSGLGIKVSGGAGMARGWWFGLSWRRPGFGKADIPGRRQAVPRTTKPAGKLSTSTTGRAVCVGIIINHTMPYIVPEYRYNKY